MLVTFKQTMEFKKGAGHADIRQNNRGGGNISYKGLGCRCAWHVQRKVGRPVSYETFYATIKISASILSELINCRWVSNKE